MTTTTESLMALADEYATLKARYWMRHDDVTEGMVRQSRDALEAAMLAERVAAPAAQQEPAIEKLSELMRGLEIPPTTALTPQALYLIGAAIADQAKAGAQPAPAAPQQSERPLFDPEFPQEGYVSDAEWAARKAAQQERERFEAWTLHAREALELIATPARPDGTWNRDREACRQLAAKVLGRYGD
jgi:hypothetical protein